MNKNKITTMELLKSIREEITKAFGVKDPLLLELDHVTKIVFYTEKEIGWEELCLLLKYHVASIKPKMQGYVITLYPVFNLEPEIIQGAQNALANQRENFVLSFSGTREGVRGVIAGSSTVIQQNTTMMLIGDLPKALLFAATFRTYYGALQGCINMNNILNKNNQ